MLLRKATFRDVEEIFTLIKNYASVGLMLERSRNMLYESLRDFVLAEEKGIIVGVCALHTVWYKLAEIRALAVASKYTKQGIGRQLVDYLVIEAGELGIKTLFTLTYQPEFFGKLGFVEVPKEHLSPKVWKECINCSKFPNCDEIAMLKKL